MAEETRQERQRRLARERKRRQRERQSLSEAAAARAADTLRRKLRLSQENEYEREMRKRKDRERIAERRRTSSLEETEERRKKEKERIAERRNHESDEATLQRRYKTAENMRRLRAGTRIRNVSATISSSMNSLIPHDSTSLSQPTAVTCWEDTGRQFENKCFENREQKLMSRPVKPCFPVHTQMHVPQHLQITSSTLGMAKSQPIFRQQEQRLAAPLQLAMAKPKPVENPRPHEKRLLAIANHQRNVMSNLASLWKSGKLCDAGIGNGSATVKVHKLVLSAVCPKLLSVSNMDKISHKFLQVNFPEVVSTEALNAFAEYMYNGILDIDPNILAQLKIIAKRLDMEELETLCDSHLPSHFHQAQFATAVAETSASAASSNAALFSNVPLIQTIMPNRAMTSSLSSAVSIAQPINIPIDIKQEISKDEPTQVKINMATMFGQEPEVVTSVVPNIRPIIKTEPHDPEDNRYGQWSHNSSNQAFTSPASFSLKTSKSTEYAIPFTETTDFKSTRLKAPHSYEAPLISDFSLVSNIVETAHSKSNSPASFSLSSVPAKSPETTDFKSTRLKAPHSYEAPTLISDLSRLSGVIKKARTHLNSMNENSLKPAGRTSNSQPSVDLEIPSNNNQNAVYPIRLFSAKGDNLPLLTKHSSDAVTLKSLISKDKT